jgi:hypothetical protein
MLNESNVVSPKECTPVKRQGEVPELSKRDSRLFINPFSEVLNDRASTFSAFLELRVQKVWLSG